MLLAIDVGNSNMVMGLYDLAMPAPAPPRFSWRMTTPLRSTSDEVSSQMQSMLTARGVSLESIDAIAVSSVVPPVDSMLRNICEHFFKVRPLFIEPGVKTGVPILTDNPIEAGADRIANCAGAFEKYGGPCIVVDMGTATTFDVVSAKGEFLGGAIAPGLGIAADALFDRAARLTRVDIKRPTKVIGTSTTDNIQIGLYYGYIGLVDGILERMIAELGPGTKAIATGGQARLIAGGSKCIEFVDEMLTLDGLRIIYERGHERNLERHRRRAATARPENAQ